MSVMMITDLVGPDWIMKSGEIYELDALREHHWIAAGYCVEWTEDDQRIWESEQNEQYVNIGVHVTENGLHIDSEQ